MYDKKRDKDCVMPTWVRVIVWLIVFGLISEYPVILLVMFVLYILAVALSAKDTEARKLQAIRKARAIHVAAMERELGLDPSPLFYEPEPEKQKAVKPPKPEVVWWGKEFVLKPNHQWDDKNKCWVNLNPDWRWDKKRNCWVSHNE
jgi:hypothetical protein